MKVPSLFTAAPAPLSAAPRLLVMMFKSAARGLVVERRSLGDRQRPGADFAHAGVRVEVVQVDLDKRPRRRAGAAQSAATARRPDQSSSEVNAAPPCASVVPDPLCVPPENAESPLAVNVPVPERRPLDCTKDSVVDAPANVTMPPLIVTESKLPSVTVNVWPEVTASASLTPVTVRLKVCATGAEPSSLPSSTDTWNEAEASPSRCAGSSPAHRRAACR